VNLYLIDGNSYIYRAYFAIRGLTNSKGLPTNAIFGFTNMLLKIIREKNPDGVIISFDSPVPTKRHAVFKEYKAQRPDMPYDLIEQIPYIKNIIEAFRIPMFEVQGYEADDVLASIAKKASKHGVNVFIVTADKDMLQIVGDNIKIYDPMKDMILDEKYVEDRYGVKPELIPDFMALAGDVVDNIPGVKGIGDKTARELLKQFVTLDNLISNVDKIKKDKLRNLILMNLDNIRISKLLSTLDISVPIEINIEELRLKEPDWQRLFELFTKLEFSSLLKYIPPSKHEFKDYEVVLSVNRIKEILSDIREEVSFDICYSEENNFDSDLLGVAFCYDGIKSYYVPVKEFSDLSYGITKDQLSVMVSELLSNDEIDKIGYDIKSLLLPLKQDQSPFSFSGKFYDVMIASYLLNPNKTTHKLEEISLDFLSYRQMTKMDIFGKGKSVREVSVDDIARYHCERAVVTYRLKGVLYKLLKEEELEDVYFKIEMPLIFVLTDMELTGVKIDIEKLEEISKEIDRELDAIKSRIYFMAGEEFNINSPKQLAKILFENLGLKPTKKKKTGFSTEMGVLEELALIHDIPREILDYRTLNKLKTTYIDVLPKLINNKTGRIHTSFNQTVTATGRLSSSEPNLQNIPIKGVWGKRIREAFICEEGFFILSADYSQVELRILAHMSKDEGLIKAFISGSDIHTLTAMELFNVKEGMVTQEMRRVAKSVNFGIIYGISPFGLSETLGISLEEAKDYIERYFLTHKGVKNFIEETLNDAREKGYVRTFFGRKRPIPEIKSKDLNKRLQGERYAVNTVIQGTAADIIKLAMIKIWNKMISYGLRSRMILQIHDELVFEVKEEDVDVIKDIIKMEMEGVVEFLVPLSVEIKYGKNWAEAHA